MIRLTFKNLLASIFKQINGNMTMLYGNARRASQAFIFGNKLELDDITKATYIANANIKHSNAVNLDEIELDLHDQKMRFHHYPFYKLNALRQRIFTNIDRKCSRGNMRSKEPFYAKALKGLVAFVLFIPETLFFVIAKIPTPKSKTVVIEDNKKANKGYIDEESTLLNNQTIDDDPLYEEPKLLDLDQLETAESSDEEKDEISPPRLMDKWFDLTPGKQQYRARLQHAIDSPAHRAAELSRMFKDGVAVTPAFTQYLDDLYLFIPITVTENALKQLSDVSNNLDAFDQFGSLQSWIKKLIPGIERYEGFIQEMIAYPQTLLLDEKGEIKQEVINLFGQELYTKAEKTLGQGFIKDNLLSSAGEMVGGSLIHPNYPEVSMAIMAIINRYRTVRENAKKPKPQSSTQQIVQTLQIEQPKQADEKIITKPIAIVRNILYTNKDGSEEVVTEPEQIKRDRALAEELQESEFRLKR